MEQQIEQQGASASSDQKSSASSGTSMEHQGEQQAEVGTGCAIVTQQSTSSSHQSSETSIVLAQAGSSETNERRLVATMSMLSKFLVVEAERRDEERHLARDKRADEWQNKLVALLEKQDREQSHIGARVEVLSSQMGAMQAQVDQIQSPADRRFEPFFPTEERKLVSADVSMVAFRYWGKVVLHM